MSFGFGVGDFLAVLELSQELRRRFVDAPEQFRAISRDVKSLSGVLQDVDDTLTQRDLTDKQKEGLETITKDCRDTLQELKDKLDTYQDMDSGAKGISGKTRRVWKRLKWDQESIEEFRSRITMNIGVFNTFLGQISLGTSFDIKDGVDRLHQRQDDRENDKHLKSALEWLSPVDYTPQHKDFIGRLYEGTGQWLFNSSEFQTWVEKNEILFCPGIPGAGKTILSAAVVDYLFKRFQDECVVAFIYCNFRRQHEQTAADILANLLKQLVPGNPTATERLKAIYLEHSKRSARPSFDAIAREFQSAISDCSKKVFIVVDALDECQMTNFGDRKRLLTALFDVQSKACLFMTSRFIPEIVCEFEGKMSLEIRAHEEDIARYTEGHISELPRFISRSVELQNLIKTEIVKVVNGMFLLAQLHLSSLSGMKSPKAVKIALANLPKGSGAYDHAYQEAMERIEGLLAGSRDLAKQVLSWITCSKRPLKVVELQHALAVEIGEPTFDEDNLSEIEDIVSVCAGLVTVEEESNVVRFVHYDPGVL